MNKKLASTSEDQDDLNFETDKTPVPWFLVLSAFVLQFAYVAVGWLTGACTLSGGRRALLPGALSDTVLYFLGYAFAVHVILVWPIAQWIYPAYEQKWSKAIRLSVVSLLLSAPLISFSSYMAGRGLIDVNELLLMVLPSVVIGALLFESTSRSWVFSLYLSVTTFIPLFVLQDQLGGYTVWFQYLTQKPFFYLLRAFFPTIAVLAVIWLHPRQLDEPKARLANVLVTFIALAVLSFVLVPATGVIGRPDQTSVVHPDPLWIIYPLMLYFLLRKKFYSYRILLVLSSVMFLWVLGRALVFLAHLEVTQWQLSSFSYDLMVLSACVWLLITVRSPDVRKLFEKS